MEMRSGQRGFSVIEVMIAAAIFLIVALGLLPLFAQSIRNNVSGRDATDISNLGKSRVEELLQVPFDSLQVPVGAEAACTAEYWSKLEQKWKAGTAPATAKTCLTKDVNVSGLGADAAVWVRTTRIQQFSLNDLQKNGTTNPLPGGAAAGLVQLKEIVVEVRSRSLNPLGSEKVLTLRTLRAV
jgi:prepilin-type N-terminal cleavage/methylation domain-containing protein